MFQVTAFSGGSFPCYTQITTVVRSNGTGDTTTSITNPFCITEGDTIETTREFIVQPDQLNAIENALERGDVFQYNDSYIDDNIVDLAGGSWKFVIDGKRKEIFISTASTKSFPKGLVTIMNVVNVAIEQAQPMPTTLDEVVEIGNESI